MHFLKIKGSSPHQDGKGMCRTVPASVAWPLYKCYIESPNYDSHNL